jgi:hypothetical protein
MDCPAVPPNSSPAAGRKLEKELASWSRLSGAINLVVRTTE